MTVTDSISGQSIGTSTNVGERKFPQKVTKQSLTTAWTVSAKLTNGATGYAPSGIVRIWYASSNFNLTAAEAAAGLRPTRYLDLRPSPHAAGIVADSGELITATGNYLFFWCDLPTVPTAQTLDVSCVELP